MEHRFAALPRLAGQAGALGQHGALRRPLEGGAGVAVVAVQQGHASGFGGQVAPQLNRPSPCRALATKQHQHGSQRAIGKQGQGNATGDAHGMCCGGAAEVRAFKLLQYEGVTCHPGLAGQALFTAKTHLAAQGLQVATGTVQAVAKLQQAAVGAGHPVFHGANECLQGDAHDVGPSGGFFDRDLSGVKKIDDRFAVAEARVRLTSFKVPNGPLRV